MKKLLICISVFLLFFVLHPNLQAQEDGSYLMEPVGDETYKAILQFYQYDKDIPLHIETVTTIETDRYNREKITFRGIGDSRVVGYLATPKHSTPPYPCVLQMHGLTLSKSDFWSDFIDPYELVTRDYHHGELVTDSLLSAGYAVLALDMPYHGERIHENNFEHTLSSFFRRGWGYSMRDMVVQSVIEYRRAIDYLETRDDIDAQRIGAIGYSLGSVVTFNLTGVDERVKSIVICATAYMRPRPFLPPEDHLSGFAPQTFLRSINERPVLILAAKNDNFNCSIDQAYHLYNLIEGENKKIIFYNSGHRLPKEHAPVAVEWLINTLK